MNNNITNLIINNIIVYIHNFAKNEEKLQMAIHIVDGFISRMNEVANVNTTGVHITQDLLEKINNEWYLTKEVNLGM